MARSRKGVIEQSHMRPKNHRAYGKERNLRCIGTHKPKKTDQTETFPGAFVEAMRKKDPRDLVNLLLSQD